jgi:RND family efflux transporter MFP subunit
MQRQGGKPTVALASADSAVTSPDSGTASGTEQAEKKDKKGKKGKEKKEEPPVPVEIAVARAQDLPAYFSATGSLEAKRQVKLIAKAAGQVVKLAVEEGNYVKKDQVLLEIEHREDELLVEQARIRAETAHKELERIQGLVGKGLTSDKDLEAAKQAAEVSALEHHLAQVRLDNKIVRAPFAGQITLREIQLGQTVNVGQSLVELADISPLEVRLFLPEKIVKTLKAGQPVEVRSDVDPTTPLEGTVDRIAPAVDAATSTVKVTLQVAAKGNITRVGSFVRARITTDVRRGATSIPKKALVPEAGVTYLFVAEADSVRKIPVTTGYAGDEMVEIVSGVAIGDRVVSVGQGGLRPGSRIKVLEKPAGPAPAPKETATTADAGSR